MLVALERFVGYGAGGERMGGQVEGCQDEMVWVVRRGG